MAKNQMQRSLLKIIYDYPKEKDKQKIWQYFESHCAYCGCEIEEGSRKGHLDHLIAISNGGNTCFDTMFDAGVSDHHRDRSGRS